MLPDIVSPPALLILWAILGYLLGSIPFGMVLTKLMNLGDLRSIGSGNIGATNVLRTGNKAAAAGTLILDGGKGAVAVLLARWLAAEDAAQLAGFMAFLGHCYPVWLRFRGGKGVATFLGLVLALSWPVGLMSCATWLAAVAMSRISSVGALVAALLSTGWMVLMREYDLTALTLVLAVLIFWRHRSNLARLKQGTEPKVSKK
ncbi:glycerol-3-phosphate acyltransferase [Salipiger pallidus]|uniref:Glycerol-3-phosphate acyltransferase n=1 Tax=Salipiger pallidus TaxID=1775170 RepID=A0A8J2ZJ06_9RHOB|nr:glycerol-3-phosphate 1-O-acyltransferase PlsY [Salipiger pallidus]GGG68224.1 glycerol-3-phosphate acyltransferase [Salipiger pallidus]